MATKTTAAIVQFDSGKAAALLKEGKRVRREAWPAKIRWVELSIDRSNPCHHVAELFQVRADGRIFWSPILQADFLATDWMLVEEPLTPADP